MPRTLVLLLLIAGPGLLGAGPVSRLPAGTGQDSRGRELSDSTGGSLQEDRDGGSRVAIGMTIGTPAGVSLVGECALRPLVVRVSGGYWGKDLNGIQGGLGVIFSRGLLYSQSIGIVLGAFRTNPLLQNDQGRDDRQLRKEHYAGIAYDATFAGFLLELGLGKGTGDFRNPQLLLQAGYSFEF